MKAAVLTNDAGGVGVRAAIDKLSKGGNALDAVEAGIRFVELDPTVRSVGLGGAPNVLGEMECDASIMCGATLRTGAVGALKDYFHAISVARQVMERTPHVMLVGEGAAAFAAETGERKGNLLSDEARADYDHWLKDHVPPDLLPRWPNVPLAPIIRQAAEVKSTGGTTVFLIRTPDGHLAGGVSTSGWAYKYPGRLGDSPIIGAGIYVDSRYGAVACTHTGEMTIRAGTARSVIAYVKKGALVREACQEALQDLRALRGGFLGPVTVHAMDTEGIPYAVSLGLEDSHYWFWSGEKGEMEYRDAVIDKN
jgi:beta-aspartyl-peptidase (threonine type)